MSVFKRFLRAGHGQRLPIGIPSITVYMVSK